MKIIEDPVSFKLPVLKVEQPIGIFYIGVLDAEKLCAITEFDIRHLLKERDLDTYLGIQRDLDQKRVKAIQSYVETYDACFPAGVILSISAQCATFEPASGILTLRNYTDPLDPTKNIPYRSIAKVIDGQHRIEGLKGFPKDRVFQVAVSIFIDIDVSEEAYIFSTVNLAQTKVNRSLAFDLFELAKTRSPQKFCHNAAVVLNRESGSPLYRRIKRLGVATEGRFDETLTQATIVDMLLPYLSKDPIADRNSFLKGIVPAQATSPELRTLLFRNMFLAGNDFEIIDIIWNYLSAVATRWPTAWASGARGDMLNKTNGFRALMRFLKPVYLSIAGQIGRVPSSEEFLNVFKRIDMLDSDFNTSIYPPGTSGEANLFKSLRNALEL